MTAILAAIGDPEGTRTVTSIVALLAAMGAALLILAVWVYRTTRPDPELLTPLEMMGERKWRRGDPVWQRRRLDEVRPADAKPLDPSVAPPELDESYDAGPEAPGFDDLRADSDSADQSVADDGEDDGEADDQVDLAVNEGRDAAATPVGVDRPSFDDTLFDDASFDDASFDDFDPDFDPEALAAARAELDRELSEPAEQLDLFSEQERSSSN